MKLPFPRLVASILAFCFFPGCSQKGGGGLKLAVIPKGTTHEFWEAIHAGAVKAERELNAAGTKVSIEWRGPLREDDRDAQIRVVEDFTASQVNGIVLAPLDDTAMVAPVELAARSKIPVVIIDSGLKSSQYVSFVATDNYKGGQLAGEHMAKLLNGQGKLVLFRYQAGSASTMEREQGFLDAVAKHPGFSVISDQEYGGATRDLALQKAENLLGRPEIRDQMNGVFCPNETVTVAMAKALRNIGKAGGQVKVIGFDTGRDSVTDLKNGDVQGLVVQDPIKMGYLGVKTLAEHLQGRSVEKRIDTGVVIITKENMGSPEMSALLNPPIKDYLP